MITTPPAKHMPTVPEWHAALARASVLGVRLFYHDAGHISFIRIADAMPSGGCMDWAALLA